MIGLKIALKNCLRELVMINKEISKNLSEENRSDQFMSQFSWDLARGEMQGLPEGGGLNIAHESVDRHANSHLRNHVAIRWLGKKERKEFTYQDLKILSNKFANVLYNLEKLNSGDSVFVLTGRIPELYICALGIWKNKNIFCPLFSAFGVDPLITRLILGKAKVLITTEDIYVKKIAGIRNSLPDLEYVIVIGEYSSPIKNKLKNTLDFYELFSAADDQLMNFLIKNHYAFSTEK
jgi:acetyl-CoA synthetase